MNTKYLYLVVFLLAFLQGVYAQTKCNQSQRDLNKNACELKCLSVFLFRRQVGVLSVQWFQRDCCLEGLQRFRGHRHNTLGFGHANIGLYRLF